MQALSNRHSIFHLIKILILSINKKQDKTQGTPQTIHLALILAIIKNLIGAPAPTHLIVRPHDSLHLTLKIIQPCLYKALDIFLNGIQRKISRFDATRFQDAA